VELLHRLGFDSTVQMVELVLNLPRRLSAIGSTKRERKRKRGKKEKRKVKEKRKDDHHF